MTTISSLARELAAQHGQRELYDACQQNTALEEETGTVRKYITMLGGIISTVRQYDSLQRLAKEKQGLQGLQFSASLDVSVDLVNALEMLYHAVCGETGFANAVRTVSGIAYPWPQLDEAEQVAAAALKRADILW